MRITRLEIFGFKSFRDRFVLNFDHNLIGIVGPNGCGKSNVVDALRWVLGEKNAKQLRGNVIEDLIFSGSDSRRPLGMAEVSITLRPDADWARRVMNSPAALLNELAEDDEPEELSSDTSSAALPEPAQPEQTLGAHLFEITGLLTASEIQLTRRLYRSGESEYFINKVPCRLRDMTDLYRLIGLGARGMSIVQQGHVGQIISKKPIERRELLEEAAGISGFRTRLEAAERKLTKTSENMHRLSDIISEVDKQVRHLKRAAARAKNRAEIKAQLTEVDWKLFQLRAATLLQEKMASEQALSDAEQKKDGYSAELQNLQAREGEFNAQVESIEVELLNLNRARTELHQRLSDMRLKKNEIEVELARAQTESRGTSENIQSVEKSIEKLSLEVGVREASLGALSLKLTELETKRRAAETELAQMLEAHNEARTSSSPAAEQHPQALGSAAVSELDELHGKLLRLADLKLQRKVVEQEALKTRGRLHQHKDALQEHRLTLARLESESGTLTRQLESYARAAAKDLGGEKEGVSSPNLTLLVSGVQVPKEYETAFASILSDRAKFLVADDCFLLLQQLTANSGNKTKRSQIGVIDKGFRAQKLPPLSSEELAAAPSARYLVDVVQAESGLREALSAIAHDAVVVNTQTEAKKLSELYRSTEQFLKAVVTLTGEILYPWGFSIPGEDTTFVSLSRRVEELEQLIKSEINLTEQSAESVSEIEAELRTAEAALKAIDTSIGELHTLQSRLNTLLEKERSERNSKEQQRMNAERAARAHIQSLHIEYATLERERELQQSRIEQIAVEKEQQREQLTGQNEHQHSLSARIEDLNHRLLEYQRTTEVEEKREFEKLSTEAESVEHKIRQADSRRNAIRLSRSELLHEVEQSRRNLDATNNLIHSLSLQVEKKALEAQMLQVDISRQLEAECQLPGVEDFPTIFGAVQGNRDAFMQSLQQNAQQLRTRLQREGEVDPDSVERFEQESVRLESMKKQFGDLDEACTTLRRTIRQLKEISRERFLETFNAVSTRYTELIPRLFGGGAGRLELLNPEDPLTSGVEVTVRPPGKNLRTLDLLSGGEKALAATAILMAMFLHRPSPICVLDEVDAPLDDANLGRFLELIRENQDKAKFLIITHNKLTMASVDRLVGITMQEKGVSTAVSVTLEESEEQVNQWVANA